MNPLNRMIPTAVVLAAGFALAAPLRADRLNDFLHQRTYVGFLGTSVSVGDGGLFSGANYSRTNNPYEVVLLPTLAQNFGWGVLLGHREEAYAMELSYWRSEHLASFGPATIDTPSGPVTFPDTLEAAAMHHSVNVDFKRYFLTELQYQPFVNLGVAFPWIDLSGAASNGTGNLTNATVAGLGLNLGAGLEYYWSPTLSFMGGIYHRWSSFDQFRGNAELHGPLDPKQGSSRDGSGFQFLVGATVGFE